VAKVEEPQPVVVPEKPKPPEPAPVAKPPEPKPEPKKAEPPRSPPTTQAPQPKPIEHKPEAKTPTKPASPAPAAVHKEEASPRDAYTAAAERWRTRGGGGMGGTDAGSGPIGAGAEGKGGGGQLVGLEFLAYRQQVINAIKERWTNVIGRPGLVASVFFEIAPDGEVSGVRLQQSSGNAAYDASALRAVQHASPLPAPPSRYANEFREFVIEFHSEERGGQGVG